MLILQTLSEEQDGLSNSFFFFGAEFVVIFVNGRVGVCFNLKLDTGFYRFSLIVRVVPLGNFGYEIQFRGWYLQSPKKFMVFTGRKCRKNSLLIQD